MKALLPTLFACMLILTACGSSDKNKSARMEGERISILELQKSLSTGIDETENDLTIPPKWTNKFWPQSGGYPNHSMQHLALGNDLSLAWKASIGKGSDDKIPLTAQPIVVDGMIYTLDTRSEMRAFDKDGNLQWKINAGPQNKDDSVITGGLGYSNGRIYVTNGHNEILAIDHKSGEIVWRKKIPSASQAAPTILDNRIYVMTVDNRLIALSEDDGAFLWDYTGISEGTGVIGAASPAASREIVIPVFSSGEVSALRVENGSLAWSDNLGTQKSFGGLTSLSDIKALPVIDKGLLIIMNFSGRMAAIDIRSGNRIWQREIGSSNTPWVAGDVIYTISSDNHLVAIDRKNGLIHWVKALPAYEDPEDRKGSIQWHGPVMAGNRLIITGSHGNIMEINAETSEVISQWRTKESISVAPIIADQTLYILTDSGKLLAYR